MAVGISHLQKADKSRQQVEAGSELALRQESRSTGTAASAVAAHACPKQRALSALALLNSARRKQA